MQLNYNMDISGMFAVLAVLAVLGILLYALVRFLHVRLVFWGKPDNLRDSN
jgi:NitT/TauT family transport system permease protein